MSKFLFTTLCSVITVGLLTSLAGIVVSLVIHLALIVLVWAVWWFIMRINRSHQHYAEQHTKRKNPLP